MFRFKAVLISVLLIVITSAAYAQYDSNDANGDNPAAANLQVQMSQLQEQIRKLQGTIEQVSFENRQLKGQLEKNNADLQYRLSALEQKGAPVASATPAPQTPDSGQLHSVEPPQNGENENSDVGAASEEASPAATPKFSTSREQYNYAFKLLNQARYAEANTAFSVFTQQYPKDTLIGNAYYWLGETNYVRRDYVKAADNFRQGYQSLPTGPKAGDNLLKLAMSLDAMNKDKEACVVLHQVVSKFVGSSVKPRAEQEINRIGCS